MSCQCSVPIVGVIFQPFSQATTTVMPLCVPYQTRLAVDFDRPDKKQTGRQQGRQGQIEAFR